MDYLEVPYLDATSRIVWAPTMRVARKIRVHMLRLAQRMSDRAYPQWPPDLNVLDYYAQHASELPWIEKEIPQESIDLCRYLRHHLYDYAYATCQYLTQEESFLWSSLEPEVWHELFIATEPVRHWNRPDEWLPGLPKIMQLLGDSYPEPGSPPGEPSVSGDCDAGILAALGLGMEGADPAKWLDVPRHLAIAVLQEASEMQKKASEAAKKDESATKPDAYHLPPVQAEPDSEVFAENKQELTQQLQNLGVNLPPDF